MTEMEERTTHAGLVAVLTLVGAIVFALIVRGGTLVVGIALLFLLFVPLEKLFSLRKQRVFRKGLLTDLTHFIANNVFVTIGAVALVVVSGIPYYWIRNLNLQSHLPTSAAITLAVALVFVGNYWGHRLTH